MSRMKRGFKLDDVNHYYMVRTPPSPFGLPRPQLATITVSVGIFEADESIKVPEEMTADEFMQSDLYPTLLANALDSLNADVEMFLNDLGERGVIE